MLSIARAIAFIIATVPSILSIPLPFTGVWTGSAAAFLFGVEYKQAFCLISLGAVLAGIIVTILTSLGINFLF